MKLRVSFETRFELEFLKISLKKVMMVMVNLRNDKATLLDTLSNINVDILSHNDTSIVRILLYSRPSINDFWLVKRPVKHFMVHKYCYHFTSAFNLFTYSFLLFFVNFYVNVFLPRQNSSSVSSDYIFYFDFVVYTDIPEKGSLQKNAQGMRGCFVEPLMDAFVH